ncbi:preprotein translocase subunit SecG [Anianabacter salinae]|uniref:preprotein translocase subunit SecG n=1 Tax=Anianabacter salinae TaxID=2851023 RepID=UPI00225E66A3|nr:preprotein translocase subunit SecG [Anianabacter salinae]MBV0912595.1 preprotein translocase subunit SecG [Anianabacter salinae]
MENVVLIIHLILALGLIGVVLLQRSEGGGLGMGGGGGGGAMSSRSAGTALGKLTWGFAIAFIGTSIFLTIMAAQNSADSSVLDRLGIEAPQSPAAPALPGAGDLTLPGIGGNTGTDDSAPLSLPRAD